MRRVFAMLVLGAATLGVATACGSSNNSSSSSAANGSGQVRPHCATQSDTSPAGVAYRNAMQGLSVRLAQPAQVLATNLARAPLKFVAHQLNVEATDLTNAVIQLKKLNPPAVAAQHHQQLIVAVTEYVNELRHVEKQVKSGNGAPLDQLETLPGARNMTMATLLIDCDGYNITGIRDFLN
jgi:hypothetical protein